MTGTGTGGILQVNPGNLKTIAGNGTAGYSGDGGAATAAELNDPDGVNFDALGNLYIADVVNSVIRKVDTAGNITTVAGNGTAGFSGDGGPATAAELNGPFGVVPDSAGNLYIQDTLNARIRRVDATTGIITTIAGNGTSGLAGDGGPAIACGIVSEPGRTFRRRRQSICRRLRQWRYSQDRYQRHHYDCGGQRNGRLTAATAALRPPRS